MLRYIISINTCYLLFFYKNERRRPKQNKMSKKGHGQILDFRKGGGGGVQIQDFRKGGGMSR